ncbi:MAG: SpoIIE family protein phosphatase [Sedimentisphaerales bacterium]|nr:SpoIIE family protein phosphatase [Sedimentisphaerales bacterium]
MDIHKNSMEMLESEDMVVLKNRALDETAEGITITNPRLADNPIIFANAGFERLTGYRVEEILGQNCRFLQGPKTDAATLKRIREAIEDDQSVTVEILNYRKDGSTFWNRVSITPVRDDVGRTTHFIAVQSDITQRREVENALRATKHQLESANQRMLKDLQTAARVQQSFLPRTLPDCRGIQFGWRFKPCEELAGDILNVVRLDKKHIGFYLLDVSGHGVSAALLSVTLSRWLSPRSGQSCLIVNSDDIRMGPRLRSPAEVAEQLNKQFPMELSSGHFFTLSYGILDIETYTVRYVSAGQPYPIYLAHGEKAALIKQSGYPIGIVSEPEYEEQVLSLRAGDQLYLYSDGVTEGHNSKGEEFGVGRLVDTINTVRAGSLEERLSAIISMLERWSDGEEYQDDVSMLGIEILPTGVDYYI